MILFLYDCINTAIFVILTFIFIRIFLGRSSGRQTIPVVIIWIILELLTVNVFENIFIVKAMCTIFLTIAASRILYKERLIKLLVLSVMGYGFYAALEFLIYFATINISNYIYIYDLDSSVIGIYVGTISEILFLIILMVMRYVINGIESIRVDSTDFVKYALFPVLSLAGIVIVGFYSSGRQLSQDEISSYTILSVFLLVSNIYIYWLIRIDVDNKILREKNRMFSIYAQDLTESYKQIREEHSQIRSIQHDYENHLTVIKALAGKGKTEELQKYLNSNDKLRMTVDVMDCGNDAVSALFNAKYAESVRKGITVRFDIGSLESVKVKNADLVIIISNLFNNAIEACSKCEGERVINVQIKDNDGMLYISFSNTYNKVLLPENGRYNTTKPDRGKHGFGLSNIREIVGLYKGQVDIIPQSDYFVVRIIMCDIT